MGVAAGTSVAQGGFVLSDWEKRSDDLERDLPKIGPYPASGLVRQARRLCDLSQRELAKATRLSQSTVARIENGTYA